MQDNRKESISIYNASAPVIRASAALTTSETACVGPGTDDSGYIPIGHAPLISLWLSVDFGSATGIYIIPKYSDAEQEGESPELAMATSDGVTTLSPHKLYLPDLGSGTWTGVVTLPTPAATFVRIYLQSIGASTTATSAKISLAPAGGV